MLDTIEEAFKGLMAIGVIFAMVAGIWDWAFGKEVPTTGVSCVDVTSYDYNWQNDMKCTRSNGTVFYTDYEGARKYK